MSNKFFFDVLLPRIVYLPYLAAKVVLLFMSLVHRLSGSQPAKTINSTLCIEAGVKGWESIEFKELYQSACEYLQPENVHQLIVHPEKNYIEQVSSALSTKSITHYLYDPRTGGSGFWLRLWQSLRLAILLQKYDVVPIVLLSDISLRISRAQSAIVSARKGVAISFMSSKCAASFFPHRRLIGPSLMPFSVKTKQMLDVFIEQRQQNMPAKAIFVGSLYEPRTTTLDKVRSGLAARGFAFEIQGRVVGSPRVSDYDYWTKLCYSDIVFTTAEQGIHYKTSSGRMVQRGADRIDISQLVYRYLEAIASGALLVAPDVPSVRRYFTPGEHFISFDSPESAIEVISHFLLNDMERLKIASQGKERADALITSRCFWMSVDNSLGSDSLI